MGIKNERVDDYIAKAADFAKPILHHLRQLVHAECPEVEEVMKWSFPNFDYKGPFCSMAAFKEHCSFGFWKAAIMQEAERLNANQDNAMGHLGKIKSLADLPPDNILTGYIKEAVMLNQQGLKLPPRKKQTLKNITVPDYFLQAISKNKTVARIFEAFSPSHKKEYLEWITGAKSEETRSKRIAKAIEQIGENKALNWKYEKPKKVAN